MQTEIVGTYNMSFASDYTEVPNFSSEYSFLLYQKQAHEFWNNTLEKLKRFIETEKPIAIGLQEININDDTDDSMDTASGRNKEKGSMGSSAIRHMLEKININYKTNYVIYTRNVSATLFGKLTEPGVSIIIDTNRVGKVSGNSKFDDSFNNQTDNFIKTVDNNGKGRPLMMLLTEKDYLFVCMHGDQTPGLGKDMAAFNADMITKNKLFLEKEVADFLNEKNAIPNSIYIMGDLNDRYDAIKVFDIKVIDRIEQVKYDGESPYSCCHNWDSAAIEERREYFDNEKKYKYGKDPDTLGDYNGKYKSNFIDGKLDKKTKIPTEDVTVGNYLYKGDKVFSSNGGELSFFRTIKSQVSKESDHELVYIKSTTNSNQSGGIRKRKMNKTKKNRKYRKYRKGKKSRKSKK